MKLIGGNSMSISKTVLIIIIITLLLIFGQCIKLVLDQVFGVAEKTLDPDNIVYNYEWFKMQYNDYLSLKSKIQIQEIEQNNYKQTYQNSWDEDAKKEYQRLSTIQTGLKYQLQDVIQEYNQKSSMINRNIFKDSELPYELNLEY